jgi:cellulose synthase/poly-beta-1,6-N-acetylglucosamine synthase-like glycosyltransferase
MNVQPILFAAYVFWACLLLILYSYLLYPILLFIAYSASQIFRDWRYLISGSDRRVRSVGKQDLPNVSLIVPAYNEESCLPEKIANLKQLDYPPEKMEVIFVSDGSSDRTAEILKGLNDPNVHTIFVPQRKGKFNALNQAASAARTEILVFSDANTLFAPDVVQKLVRHFSQPTVGVVCGIVRLVGDSEFRQTEGVYWKYESMLRMMEGRLGATLNACGAIYALRRYCYKALEPGDIIDDFIIPYNARKMGYRVLSDPEAIATEYSVNSVKDEYVRRVRLAVGSFRALPLIYGLPLANFVGFALFSHKLLRWIVPFLMIGTFVSNMLVLNQPLYRMLFLCQVVFYLWAGFGFLYRQKLQRTRFALLGYFMVAIHVAFLAGFWRYLWGQSNSTWQRTNRRPAEDL